MLTGFYGMFGFGFLLEVLLYLVVVLGCAFSLVVANCLFLFALGVA